MTISWVKAGEDRWKHHAALAAFSCAMLALTAAMRLWWSWDFQYWNPTGVRGWVWASRYPKHQETAAYVISLASVAIGVLASRPIWWMLARPLQRLLPVGANGALHASAAVLLATVVGIPLVAGPVWSVVVPLWLPFTLVSALALATGVGAAPARRRRPTKTYRTVLVAVVVPILLYLLFYDGRAVVLPVNLFEDGAMLGPLQASLSGGRVYRSAHLQHGLFHNLGKPLLASIFEVSLTSYRAVDALFRPLGYVALYCLGLAIYRSAWTALALTLIFCSPYLHVSDRQSFGLLSVALLALAVRREADGTTSPRASKAYFAASGLCTTLAFFYSTEVGLYAGAACGGFTLVRAILARDLASQSRLVPLVSYGAGAALTSVPFLAYFLWQGVFLDFVHNIHAQCAYQAAAWGRSFDSLADATSHWRGLRSFAATRAFRAYVAPAVYLALVGVVVFRLTRPGFWRSTSSQTLLLLALAATAWFRTTLGRFDGYHIAEGTPFVWTIVLLHAEYVVAAARQATTSWRHARAAVLIAAGGLLVVVDGLVLQAAYRIPTAITRRVRVAASGALRPPALGPATDRLGALEEPAWMLDDLRAVILRIHELTQPGEVIFDFTNQAGLYFLADRRSPSRHQSVVYSATQEMDRELIEALEKERPRLVVFESSGPIATYLSKIDGVPITTRHPQVAEYLSRQYRFAEDVGRTKLYVRRDTQP